MTGPQASSRAATLKECPCCGARYGAASWRRLALCGEMGSGRTRIELRQCACESTIALRVSGDGVLDGEAGDDAKKRDSRS